MTPAARFPRRHLTATDRKILGVLLEENGPAEILIALGQYLATELHDRQAGDAHRSQLLRIARDLADAPTRP
jgi:hypothetical protein